MAPQEAPQEACHGCAAGLFMEYPLVPTRKHIEEDLDDVVSLADSEKDPDDLAESTPVPAPSLVGKLLDMNPCSSCYSTPEPIVSNLRTCCGCDRGLNEKDICAGEIKIRYVDDIDESKLGEKEVKFYCYECAKGNQGRANHASDLKIVMDELLVYIVTKKEKQEQEKLESFARENNRNNKGRGFDKMKKAIKDAFSSLKKSKRHLPKPELQTHELETSEVEAQELNAQELETEELEVASKDSENTEDTEEFPTKNENIQTVFSSPTSLHYQFDNTTNERAALELTKKKRKNPSKMMKKAFSKSKEWLYILEKKSSMEDCTRVKTVAVVW